MKTYTKDDLIRGMIAYNMEYAERPELFNSDITTDPVGLATKQIEYLLNKIEQLDESTSSNS